jgi:RNA polymerase sigma factor for flagellar operon FliA
LTKDNLLDGFTDMTVAYSSYGKPASRRDARRELVEEYGSMVRKVAHRIFRRLPDYVTGFEEDDLISVGVIGLLDARERFDPDNGTPFGTFAEFRVKGAILDEIRKHDFFPRRLRTEANKLAKAEKRLEKQLARPPREEEVAEAMSLSLDELARLRDKVAPYSFVAPEDHGPMRGSTPDPQALLAAKNKQERMVRLLGELPEREQLILDLYFNRELTLSDIGEVLDLTPGRISQLKSKALATLRERF